MKNIRRDVEYKMSEEMNLKKYFIKDEELSSINEDKLSSKDVVKNITEIIDNTKPPFAIAVTGRTGSGKSSIINLVAEKYNKNTDDYNVEKINVWKQEESLKNILDNSYTQTVTANVVTNTQSAEEAEKARQNLIDSYYNQEAASDNYAGAEEEKKEKSPVFRTLKKVGKFVLTFFICFIITTLIFVFMEYMGNRSIYTNDIFFVENTYINYRENFWLIMIFTFGLTAIAYIVSTLMLATKKSSKQSNGVETNNQNTYNERNASNAATSNTMVISKSLIDAAKTNIIIIEDVDKLPAAKMLKALEDVKHCTDYENCVFIVPFDEKVLAKAIDVRNQIKLSANYRPLKFERILDKVFQFKIYVPRIASGNIKDYAIELAREAVPSFIEEYCELATFEKVIRNVLIYKNVTTPRHVKKLINNFINNRILVANRIASGRIDASIIEEKNFDLELAKISVLQADFEEFYNVLFKDFDYLEELTNLYCMDINDLRIALENLDDELKPFMTDKNRSLMNFLVQTKNYKIENMSTLMYLTKVKSEKMYKDRTVLSYVLGEEDISELRIQEVVELVKLIDNKEDLKQFTANNFTKLLEKYKENASNKVYFNGISEIVDINYDYIDEPSYIQYLEVVAENYNYYPEEALQVFKNLKIEIPTRIMNVLIVKINESISKENYDETFDFLRDNSDSLYEEEGNVSEYVQFLVDNINLSSKPTEVIEELDENFTRIGKVYELNKNIQNLDNLDYDKAYSFIGKCLDNGDLDRMVNVMNNILSEENTIDNCLKIEEKMDNFNLVDVVECNVDDIITAEENEAEKFEASDESNVATTKFESKFEEFGDFEDFDGSEDDEQKENKSQEQVQTEEDITSALENAKLLDGNYTLLKNIIEICAIKQTYVAPVDTMKIIEKALQNTSDSAYILSVFEVLNKFDRMYFYEKRRDFNEIIYACFHNSQDEKVKKNAIEITRFFKNTRLFLTKLNDKEKKIYEKF